MYINVFEFFKYENCFALTQIYLLFKGIIMLFISKNKNYYAFSGECPEPENECTFEGGKCGWANDDTADFLWAETGGENAGDYRPPIDHSTLSPSGRYIYNNAYKNTQPGES